MAVSTQDGAGRKRAAAQELFRLHRLLAGALQFENAHGAFAAGDGEAIVEHSAGRARALAARGAQELDARRAPRAAARDLAPRAGKRREAADVVVYLARRFRPVDARLA